LKHEKKIREKQMYNNYMQVSERSNITFSAVQEKQRTKVGWKQHSRDTFLQFSERDIIFYQTLKKHYIKDHFRTLSDVHHILMAAPSHTVLYLHLCNSFLFDIQDLFPMTFSNEYFAQLSKENHHNMTDQQYRWMLLTVDKDK
jgi:hypothetical protein